MGNTSELAATERPHRLENLDSPPAQRDPVPALRLHPHGRVRPHAAGGVDLVPRRQPDLAAVNTRSSNASLIAGATDVDARTVSMAPATSLWGSARLCCTMSPCGPRTGRTRSHGLSALSSIATAHSSTARMRWRTARAVSAFTCQMGVRISSTSALVTWETGRSPMRGNALRSRLRRQFCAASGRASRPDSGYPLVTVVYSGSVSSLIPVNSL